MSYVAQINPDRNVETNSFDGWAGRAGMQAWTNLLTLAGNGKGDTETRVQMALTSSVTLDMWQGIRRGFMLFYIPDGPIPAGAIVESANVSLFSEFNPGDNFSTSLTLTDSDPASNTGLSTADYLGGPGTVEYTDTRVTLLSMGATTRFEFELNAAGLAALGTAIVGQTVFKTGIRFSHDFDNTEPTWVSNVQDDVYISSADNANASRWPYLEVTFRIGPGNATVKVTGEKGNSADGITIDTWVVEIFS